MHHRRQAALPAPPLLSFALGYAGPSKIVGWWLDSESGLSYFDGYIASQSPATPVWRAYLGHPAVAAAIGGALDGAFGLVFDEAASSAVVVPVSEIRQAVRMKAFPDGIAATDYPALHESLEKALADPGSPIYAKAQSAFMGLLRSFSRAHSLRPDPAWNPEYWAAYGDSMGAWLDRVLKYDFSDSEDSLAGMAAA